jgi:ATP-binding protein involved in chromosome partitioning
MDQTVAAAREALRHVTFPGFRRDVVSLGVIRELSLREGRLEARLDPGPDRSCLAELTAAVRAALAGVPGVREVAVSTVPPPASAGPLRLAGARPAAPAPGSLEVGVLPGVRAVVAVASGKGGVGKSTVAVNLAAALALERAAVGLLDADIYGPSIPLMLGTAGAPELTPERKLVPFERFGVRYMSLGFLVPPEQAVIWRGPMVVKAVDQLLRDVVWGALDVLVIDLPPGTGDAQLTVSQKVRLAGAVIVTTPQDVALADARKGVAMFRKVDVPILGLVENMSGFVCPTCGTASEIFGRGGGRREAERLGVRFLGEVPLDPAIRRGGDEGQPLVCQHPASPPAETFRRIAVEILRVLEILPGSGPGAGPAGSSVFERFRRIWGGSGA